MRKIDLNSRKFNEVRDYIYNAGLYLGYNTVEEEPIIVLYDSERNEIFSSKSLKELKMFARAYNLGYTLGRKHGSCPGNVKHSV